MIVTDEKDGGNHVLMWPRTVECKYFSLHLFPPVDFFFIWSRDLSCLTDGDKE